MDYDIELTDFPGLSNASRPEAIRTFRECLEQRLGGASGVLAHRTAYLKAMESDDDSLPHAEAESAAAFMVARRLSERAAFEKLNAPSSAHFVVVPRLADRAL